MAASWKKIVLEGLEASLNEITASNGIRITSSLTLQTGADNTLNVLTLNSDGNVKTDLSQTDVGGEGTSLNSFVTMSIGGTPVISASQNNDTLTIDDLVGNPLTIVGDNTGDNITLTVATQSIEEVQDYASTLLGAGSQGVVVGDHEAISINYDDPNGTISLTGSLPIVYHDTTTQTGVNLGLNSTFLGLGVSSSEGAASGLTNTSNVEFVNITSSVASANGFIGPNGVYNGFLGGNGNISQTTLLQINNGDVSLGYDLNFSETSLTPGDYISASAVHIANTTPSQIERHLSLSGDFIFQGYGFSDRHVLTHNSGNLFGSGSMPTALANNHQFTGSLIITGSEFLLQSGGEFIGNGSGIYDIPSIAFPQDLLTGSSQIASAILGAYTADQTTLSLTNDGSVATGIDGKLYAITSSGAILVNGYSGLASGVQIYNKQNNLTGSFLTTIAAGYVISASREAGSGIHIATTGGVIGSSDDTDTNQNIAISISSLNSATLTAGDMLAWSGSSGHKHVSASNLAFITASVSGTLEEIQEGNGISVTNPTGYGTPTTPSGIGPVLPTTIDIILSGSAGTFAVGAVDGFTDSNLLFETSTNKLGLNPKLSLQLVEAADATITHLKVSDPNDITNLNTTTLTISDNLMLLNSNIEESGEEGGMSVNRGNVSDANLFWDENSRRWSINLGNLQESGEGTGSLTTSPESHLVTTTNSSNAPSSNPIYGVDDTGANLSDSSAVGQIHVHTDTTYPEVWIYA